ncbi:MAG: metallophosphoesterase [Eubacteriales bacterium]|nr:metallophosphoesterase [Eubacteriales bacterium]
MLIKSKKNVNLKVSKIYYEAAEKGKDVMNYIRKLVFKRARKKQSWKEVIFVLAGLGIFTVFLEMWKELHEFVIRRCRIVLPQRTASGEAVRIAFLSDLHGKCYGKNNQELIAAIIREKPDYILVGGDMLTRGKEATDRAAAALLKELVKISPVYMANGNHEQKLRMNPAQYGDRYARYIKKAESMGVHVLENRSEHVDMKGIPVTISGLEIPTGCYGHFRTQGLRLADIKEKIGGSKKEEYQILLAHSPVYFKIYAKWGADLTLSGHLHGGIINLPGIGALITPQAKLFPKYSGGTYQEGNRVCVVSRGLGTHTVNIRLFNPAELIMITLCPENCSCANEGNQV